MAARDLEEYTALRRTILARGTARAWMLLAGFAVWAALATATASLTALPVATLLPLLMLAVTFEIVFALHTGIERIGQYIHVFFEDEGADPGWEHRIMAYGQSGHPAAADPLLTSYFWLATCANFVPAFRAGPAPVEWSVIGTIHVMFIFRVGVARRQAAHQRATDLARFRQIKATEPRHRERGGN